MPHRNCSIWCMCVCVGLFRTPHLEHLTFNWTQWIESANPCTRIERSNCVGVFEWHVANDFSFSNTRREREYIIFIILPLPIITKNFTRGYGYGLILKIDKEKNLTLNILTKTSELTNLQRGIILLNRWRKDYTQR